MPVRVAPGTESQGAPVISIFAQTGVVDNLEGAVDTTGVTGWDFLWAALFIFGGMVLASTARRFVRRYGKRSEMPDNIVDLMGTLIMWSVIPVTTILGLTFVGLDVQPIFLVFVLVLVVFAVGGRSLLESFGAGIMLQTRSPFMPGDFVTVHGVTGTVVQVDSRVVVVNTVDGRTVGVPNAKVLASPIENHTVMGHRMSTLLLDVEYGTNLDFAITTALDAIGPLDEVLAEPAPSCRVGGFGDSSVRLALRFWHRPEFADELDAVDVAARSAYKAFYDNGIVFAFPNITQWNNPDNTVRPEWVSDQSPEPRTQNPEATSGTEDVPQGPDSPESHTEEDDGDEGRTG